MRSMDLTQTILDVPYAILIAAALVIPSYAVFKLRHAIHQKLRKAFSQDRDTIRAVAIHAVLFLLLVAFLVFALPRFIEIMGLDS